MRSAEKIQKFITIPQYDYNDFDNIPTFHKSSNRDSYYNVKCDIAHAPVLHKVTEKNDYNNDTKNLMMDIQDQLNQYKTKCINDDINELTNKIDLLDDEVGNNTNRLVDKIDNLNDNINCANKCLAFNGVLLIGFLSIFAFVLHYKL